MLPFVFVLPFCPGLNFAALKDRRGGFPCDHAREWPQRTANLAAIPECDRTPMPKADERLLTPEEKLAKARPDANLRARVAGRPEAVTGGRGAGLQPGAERDRSAEGRGVVRGKRRAMANRRGARCAILSPPPGRRATLRTPRPARYHSNWHKYTEVRWRLGSP